MKRGTVCGCDVHFQQDIVKGAADGAYFAGEKLGYVKPIDPSVLRQELAGVSFKTGTIMGATKDPDFLALDTSRVKATYEHSKAYFSSSYAEGNHPFFKSRQFAD